MAVPDQSNVDIWIPSSYDANGPASSIANSSFREEGDDGEGGHRNELKSSENRGFAVPRNIISLPKVIAKKVWRFLRISIKSLGRRNRPRWYDSWDDSTLPSRPSLREEGSLSRPPIVIEDEHGVPSDILISKDQRLSLQAQYFRRLRYFLHLSSRPKVSEENSTSQQSYFLGPNQVVV